MSQVSSGLPAARLGSIHVRSIFVKHRLQPERVIAERHFRATE